jgi:hypothetical protein
VAGGGAGARRVSWASTAAAVEYGRANQLRLLALRLLAASQPAAEGLDYSGSSQGTLLTDGAATAAGAVGREPRITLEQVGGLRKEGGARGGWRGRKGTLHMQTSAPDAHMSV